MTTPYWLLGAPFDVVTLDEARERIFAAAGERKQLLFATPNVNFVAQASRDPRFREDILRTGLSLVDGMPLVWIGKLLGVPFNERVAGSDLLESLITQPRSRPLRVFFFGGEPEAATAAMQAVNQRRGGLVAVGAHYPGFVSIEDMSTDKVINLVNDSNADLLVVALGAAKGHRWMEVNRHRLNVPVICHLGAAVNFVAGRLNRAPRALRALGMEWMWRIKEEPALFSRYAKDGLFLLRTIAGFVIPEMARQKWGWRQTVAMEAVRRGDGRVSVTVSHGFGEREVAELRQLDLADLMLTGITRLDVTAVGWLYANQYRCNESLRLPVYCDSASSATLKRWRAEFLAAQRNQA